MKRKNKEMVIESVKDQRGNFQRKSRHKSMKKKTRQRRNKGTDDQSVVIHAGDQDTVDISSDILFKILSCLPAKFLFQYKCVSKETCSLINDPLFALEHSARRRLASANPYIIPFTGFFVRQSNSTGHKPLFFKSIDTDAGGLPDSSLSFLKENQSKDERVKILDSCNGLLLCKISPRYACGRLYYVCNPLTMKKVFVPLPRDRKSTYRRRFALIVQSNVTGYLCFKVVCVLTTWKDSEHSKLWVFSSQSGEWEEFKFRLPALSQLISKRTKIVNQQGTLFWDCFDTGKYILVCYLNNKPSLLSSSRSFELIECPSKDQYVRFLWDYNGKILLYSHGYELYEHDVDGKFSAWSLCFNDDNKMEWKIESSLQFKNLAEDIWMYCFKPIAGRQLPPRNKWHRLMPRPELEIVGYNPISKTVYVSMDNALVSYQLVERRIELVYGTISGSYYPMNVVPYVHSLEHIEIGRTQTVSSTTVDNETEYDDGDGSVEDYPILVEDDGPLELMC